MESAKDYFSRTESAAQHLFKGIGGYLSVLRSVRDVVFVTGKPPGPERDAEFAAWYEESAPRRSAAQEAERKFVAETFALDTLCGAVLQIACKAIEVYSQQSTVPLGIMVKATNKHAKYCIGREVRSLPIGLVIYAARNQHIHFNEGFSLKEKINIDVFGALASNHGYGATDPAFDLRNPRLHSYAGNITALLEWRSFNDYMRDMREMLAS